MRIFCYPSDRHSTAGKEKVIRFKVDQACSAWFCLFSVYSTHVNIRIV